MRTGVRGPSGAKAQINLGTFMYELKLVPFKTASEQRLSAKHRPLHWSHHGRVQQDSAAAGLCVQHYR
jgi:hypothetical protein